MCQRVEFARTLRGKGGTEIAESATGGGARILDERDGLQISAAQLCSWDPLAKLLVKSSHDTSWRLALIAFGTNALLGLALGVAISVVHQRAGHQFLSVFHVRELPWALFSELVVAPIIWVLYASQPRWILQVFQEVSQAGVIAETNQSITLEGFVQQNVSAPLNKNKAYFFLVALATGAAVVLIVRLTPYPYDYPSFYGFSTGWWLLNPVYYWLIWVPLFVFIPGYAVAWLIVRQAVAIRSFGELCRAFGLVLKPFHPDQCNGLAAIGNYAMRSASGALLFGVWLLVFLGLPMVYGEPIDLRYPSLLLLTVYPVAVLALLIPPVWETHVAMGVAKAKELEGVASQIRQLLLESETEWISTSTALLEQFEKKYRLMDREYRTWPFNVPRLRGFGLTAAIPWLSALASILTRLYVARMGQG